MHRVNVNGKHKIRSLDRWESLANRSNSQVFEIRIEWKCITCTPSLSPFEEENQQS
jgi:hypothetical protein